jgi:tRNA pseudouridine38-40 synthase
MPHLKLTIAYDGTGLVGWQRQAEGVSIQGLLEQASAELDGQAVAVAGAGRTDAGVHALGQVASLTLVREIAPDAVVRALNTRLPQAVRVLEAVVVPNGFHARFDARRKSYRYRIANGSVLSPFERAYAWHVPAPTLDVEAMASAAVALEGHHDFKAFQGTGGETHGTEREVHSVRVTCAPGADRIIVFDLSGSGFLRHMVRNIVGTLVEVGRGRRRPGWVAEVLAAGDRTLAGRTAPAAGLFLVSVEYDRAGADTGSKI